MNSNWRNRPTTIDEVPATIDWIVSIDESGSSDLKYIQKSMVTGATVDSGSKLFTITACAIKTNSLNDSRDIVMSVKNKYWENALYCYKDEEKRVCFHSKEIRSKKGAFNPTLIDYPKFITDLSDMIYNIPMTLFSASVNKYELIQKYVHPSDPYDLCMNFVLERLMWNIGKNEDCYIILESRGKKEDKMLLDKIKYLIDYGNNMNEASTFSKIKGVYFNPKWSRIADNKKSYWELELSDLCAYPIHKYLAYGTMDPAFDVLKNKICGFPNFMGRGLKKFP